MKKKLILIFIIIVLIFLGVFAFLYFKDNKDSNYENYNSTANNTINNNAIENATNNYVDDSFVDIELEKPTISEEEKYNENKYNGDFELPIDGCTGYASVSLPLYAQINSSVITNLKPGQAFKIVSESGDFFKVELSNSTCGFVESKYCFVNLPDIIPSIIYDDTNSYKSIFRSSGYALENITDKQLYNVYIHNNRLEKDEFLMPLLYPMSKKIAQVQKKALENGDSLKIYETFRPYEVQMNVSNSLTKLMNSNETVKNGITTLPWDKSWFIAVQLSNHQRGVALDVSLAKIQEKEYKSCGPYSYFTVSKYEEYKMPTQMHELSRAAATFSTPVDSKSKTAWKNVKFAPSMNDAAIKLQNYFTSFGLTPLASEWWHFNDLDTRELTKNNSSNGKYYLTECLSSIPN